MLFGLVGVQAQKVRRVSLGGDPGDTRHGQVIEGNPSSAKYNWMETSKLYPKPEIVTGSHRFYRKYGKRESEAHAKCFTHFLGDGQVTLKATSDSAIAKLGFGNSLAGFSNPVWVKHCRVKYRVGYL